MERWPICQAGAIVTCALTRCFDDSITETEKNLKNSSVPAENGTISKSKNSQSRRHNNNEISALVMDFPFHVL